MTKKNVLANSAKKKAACATKYQIRCGVQTGGSVMSYVDVEER